MDACGGFWCWIPEAAPAKVPSRLEGDEGRKPYVESSSSSNGEGPSARSRLGDPAPEAAAGVL